MRKALFAAAALVFQSGASDRTLAQTPAVSQDWQDEYAYTLGIQAYGYGFPYLYLSQLRWLWVTQPPNSVDTPYAPLNHFWNAQRLATAEFQEGGSPNNDTMYSVAWIDLRREPVILSVPDIGDRYYTMEIAGFDSDNFAYVGTRTTGSKAGNYAIVGPGWTGKLPEGVTALPPSLTPYALILGRTLVSGPEDVSAVGDVMAKYKLTPLGLWGAAAATRPEDRDVWKPFDPKADPLAEWKTINQAMAENPPPAAHAALLALFAQIGVGPGLDVDKQDEPTKRALARAAVDGRKLLAASIVHGARMKVANGWKYPPPTMGRAGQHNDFLTRGGIQCLGGIISNDPQEAVYLNTNYDANGRLLDDANRYILRFAPGELPRVRAFWSMTLYDNGHNLVANPINRYSVGDRTPGLKRDADGGLTIYVQSDSPSEDNVSNWLPAPKGTFNLVLRTYLPATEIVNQSWSPPPLRPQS